MSLVKTYRTTCNKKAADGSIRTIQVNRKYTVKPPAITPEQAMEVKKLHALGVAKSKLCMQFGVSLYMINKVLADAGDC